MLAVTGRAEEGRMLGVSLHNHINNQTLCRIRTSSCPQKKTKSAGRDRLLALLTTDECSPSGIRGKGNDHSADIQTDGGVRRGDG